MHKFNVLQETPFFQRVIQETANPRLANIYEQLSKQLDLTWDKHTSLFEEVTLALGGSGSNLASFIYIEPKYRLYNLDADIISSISAGIVLNKMPKNSKYHFNSGKIRYGEGLFFASGSDGKSYDFTMQDLYDQCLIKEMYQEVNIFLDNLYDNFLLSFHSFTLNLTKGYDNGDVASDCPKEVIEKYVENINIPFKLE